MKRVLVTGSNGLLGQKLINLLCEEKYDVFALSRGENRNSNKSAYTYYNVDLVDYEKLHNIVDEIKPDFIVNTAAMTNVDQCEDNKEECDIINVELVSQLTEACKRHNIYLVHISTDFIFDGKDGPYKEEDKPNPVNYYGLSKLRSEEVILNTQINYTILRTILVYGLVDGMSRNNIILWIKEAVENKKEVTIIDDQFRMPTLVDDLANACLLAIQKNAVGIFNVSSTELLSIYDMAIAVADAFNLDKNYIKRVSTQELNQRAPRPIKTGFDLAKSHKTLGLPLFTFKEGLQRFKNQLNTV